MDTALYKKGAKKGKGKVKGKRQGVPQDEQYEHMMTPRNENMEQIEEHEEGEHVNEHQPLEMEQMPEAQE